MIDSVADNRVRLRVDGVDYGGWLSISITAGIERIARDFSLSVTDRWPGQATAKRVRPGQRCAVYIGQDLVLTGWIDATPVQHDAQQVSVGVQGRSLTADLVDCGAICAPGQWRGQLTERIAADLAQPYGVTVRALIDTGGPVADHQVQWGESASECLDRILRMRHVLATDNERGELVLIDVGTERAVTALVVGGRDGNVLSGEAGLDFKDRFSEYRAKGQRPGDDTQSGKATAGESASSTDTNITRTRVLAIKQSGQADEGTCQDRADYESDVRMGKSLAVTYRVAGWRQADGTLWRPNLRVRVQDPIIGLDREMILSEVEYSIGEGGTIATLQLAPEEAFVTADWKKKRAKKAKGQKKSGAGVTGVDEWVDFTKGP